MRKLNIISGAFWLFFSLAAALECLQYRLGNLEKPGSGFIPFVAAFILGGLALVLLLQALFSRERGEKAEFHAARGLKPGLIVLGLFGYAWLLDKLGFIILTFLFLLFLLKVIGAQAWRKSLVFSLLVVLFSYFLFHEWLKSELPPGPLGF